MVCILIFRIIRFSHSFCKFTYYVQTILGHYLFYIHLPTMPFYYQQCHWDLALAVKRAMQQRFSPVVWPSFSPLPLYTTQQISFQSQYRKCIVFWNRFPVSLHWGFLITTSSSCSCVSGSN